MKCEELFTVIPRLLAGDIDKETEKKAYEHLMACEECRRELAFWSSLANEIPPGKMPESRKRHVRQALFPKESGALDLTISAVKVMFKMIKVAF